MYVLHAVLDATQSTGQTPYILPYPRVCKVAGLSRDGAERHAPIPRSVWQEIKGATVVTQV